MEEKITGIYKIVDGNTEKVYIGQSKDIYKRLKQHKRAFISGSDTVDLYRECTNPKFQIVTTCEESRLNELEMFYIGLYNSFLDGFNMTIGGQYSMSDSVELVFESNKELDANEFHKVWTCGVKSGVIDEDRTNWDFSS